MKANEMHYFSNLFDKVLYVFQTDPLSISSISTLYKRNRYLSCYFCWRLLADANRTSMTNTCCVYTVLRLLTMDSRSFRNMQNTLSNKSEKQCISLAFSIRMYHDARSSECQILMYRPFVSSWPMKTVAKLADGSILYVKPTVAVEVQDVPLPTKPGSSLIIPKPMKILQ